MKIMEKYHTQRGLTLVEVLAALVILGIVFIGYMTIFPQMTLTNEKTETKLDTMNLAREEMSKLTSLTYTETDLMNLSNKFMIVLNVNDQGMPEPTKPYTVTMTGENTEYKSYKVENKNSDYTFTVNVFNVEELEGSVSLYKVILKIYTGGTTPNSETYGYLKVSI
ncbi:type IV pilus modification PilV family protein [Paenisporosarcina indica]|uniref:type IV pilus modification PilV family protein n=1 Tax=Paenisporosarcina indica TaxID=650093 RepID=UPI00094F7003|nr:type II secretion system protein [Paenisporosarcina indica]